MSRKKPIAYMIMIGLILALLIGNLSGCNVQAALEDRTYVESIHITPVGEEYQFQCILSYMDSQSLEQLKAGLDGAVIGGGSTEQQGKRTTEMTTEESIEGPIGEQNNRRFVEENSRQSEDITSSENNNESKKNDMSDSGNNSTGSSSEDGTGEYTAVAKDMKDFNQEYYRITGSNFDYSHLQGIYLDPSLYHPELAEDILENIWEETQAVLSTPIYQEGIEIGDQKEETLGDWLKETK